MSHWSRRDWLPERKAAEWTNLPPPPPPPPPSRILPLPPPPPPPPQDHSWGIAPPAKPTTTDLEFARILSLPVLLPEQARCPDPEGYARTLYHPLKPPEFKLRPKQIDAVYAYERGGGALIPLGVGYGKTYASLLCAKVGIQRRGHFRAAIMLPVEVMGQLVTKDLPLARRLFTLDGLNFYPVLGDRDERRRICGTPGPGIWIYSYSSLSTETGYEELMAINATLYICDEAHCLSRPDSARTKRWMSGVEVINKLCEEKRMGPDVAVSRPELVALSGTVTKKAVEDYAHLAAMALGDMSPVPLHAVAVKDLGNGINAEFNLGLNDEERARFRRLINWATSNGFPVTDPLDNGSMPSFQDASRAAFQARLRTCFGVISSQDTLVDASLHISWRQPTFRNDADSDKLLDLMHGVLVDMVTPDGDPIDYAMHTSKWLWELSGGIYNSLRWPTVEQIIMHHANQGRAVNEYQAEALLQAAIDHHELVKAYHKTLRHFLDGTHMPGCDTPMLVAAEIARQREGNKRHDLPSHLVHAYWEQRDAYYEDLPTRISVPVRVCDYKVRAALDWCKEHKKDGGLIWFHHPDLGAWLSEYLEEAGVAHSRAFAGENEAAYTPGLVVSSFAHHVGKNLQHQFRNLFLELRREASVMEQTLGRTHRSGQKHDAVHAELILANGFDQAFFNNTLKDADYIQTTTGTPQRLCYATYSPIVPPTSLQLAKRLGLIPQNTMTIAQPSMLGPITNVDPKRLFTSVF